MGLWGCDAIGSIKRDHMRLCCRLLSDVTTYFKLFSPLIANLCKLVAMQNDYINGASAGAVDPKLPLTHESLAGAIQSFIGIGYDTQQTNTTQSSVDSGHDDDEPQRIRHLVFDAQPVPSFITKGDRSFVASKLKRSGVIVDVQHPAKRPKTASGPSEPVKSGTIRVTRASTRANGEPSARTTRASTARAASSSTRVTRALTRANAACTTRASTSCAASSGSRNSRRQAG